jgi:hypothetical protein
LDTVVRSRARRRLAELDQQPVARAQSHILAGLVRRAQHTPFGRAHDFGRIRTPDDFRRLVPLSRSLTGGEAAAPSLGPSQAAVWTALAFVLHARPRARLFRGRLLLVGGEPPLMPDAHLPPGGRVVGALGELPPLIQPYVLRSTAEDGDTEEERLRRLARRSAGQPVTCITGETGRLLRFFAYLQELSGRNNAAEVWPDLVAVLHGGDRARLAEAAGTAFGAPPPLLLETCLPPDGPIAVEDPRSGLLRLLTDHGVFFEFVPAAQVSSPQPTRLGAAEVEPEVAYALVLTGPGGLWACLTCVTVCFERREPPLLRLVQTGAAAGSLPPPRADAAVLPFPLQPPHPRTAGSLAAHPGTPGHNPWSARAGRG